MKWNAYIVANIVWSSSAALVRNLKPILDEAIEVIAITCAGRGDQHFGDGEWNGVFYPFCKIGSVIGVIGVLCRAKSVLST